MEVPMLTDALLTTVRVFREMGRVLSDDLSGRRDSGIASSSRAITAEWLTRVFAPHHPTVRVTDVQPLSEVHGTTTHIRLRLSYDRPAEELGLPATMFAKLTPYDLKTRLFVSLFNLPRSEARFYEQLGAEVESCIPRIYYSKASRRGGRFVILMEDLGTGGYTMKNTTTPCSLDEARSVIRLLASIHGRFWDSPRLQTDLAWLLTYEKDKNIRFNRLMRRVALSRTIAKCGEMLPDEVRSLGRVVNQRYDDLERCWAKPPQTLIHGDAHVGNMYFGKGSVGLFDWQVVRRGQGMRDVSYFMIQSLATETRREHERELIQLYLDSLAETGASPPAFETAWEQYRSHVLYTWIAVIVTAAAATFQTEAVVLASLERVVTAMIDLDSAGILRSLPA